MGRLHNDIVEKFVALQEDLPLRYDSDEDFVSVKSWLTHLQHHGPTSQTMLEVLHYIHRLKKVKRYAEAGQLLLVSVATESPLALYTLAKELERGMVFQQNLGRAFALFSTLADEGYPHALCDLARFYYFGIVVPRDKARAHTYQSQAIKQGYKCLKSKVPGATGLFSQFAWHLKSA